MEQENQNQATLNQENLNQSNRLKNIIESLLFVARKPLSPADIEKAILVIGWQMDPPLTKDLIEATLEELLRDHEGRGINIVKVAGGYLMGTNPENADFIHHLLHEKLETTLSHQALETLAIISYKQPVTKTEIERIRGVNSDGTVDTLVTKKLVGELGRSDAPGRPYLYGTTKEFLRHFGLKDLASLPPLPLAENEQDDLFKTALHE